MTPSAVHIRRVRSTSATVCRGFTLVEMLVVITIISILVGLITMASMSVLASSRQAAIKSEIGQLDHAMRQFKAKYGEYPPLNITGNEVNMFVARAFPQYRPGPSATAPPTLLSGAESLVYWLSPLNDDPTNPFVDPRVNDPNNNPSVSLVSPPARSTKAFFDFDKTRLKTSRPAGNSSGNAVVYLEPRGQAPYVYFPVSLWQLATIAAKPSAYPSAWYPNPPTYPLPPGVAFSGVAGPYCIDVDKSGQIEIATGTVDTYANADSFQIIAAGTDNDFGPPTAIVLMYPLKAGSYATGELDNLSNFCDKGSFQDAMP